MAYGLAKLHREALETRVALASETLNAIPGIGSGRMGLTPDSVKASPAYRAARAEYEEAFSALRAQNAKMARRYKAEMRAERRQARGGQA